VVKPVLSEGTALVLDDMLVFYDRLAEQDGSDGKYLEEIALANRRVGDIRHHLGQLDQAKTAYENALALYEKLDQSSADKSHLVEKATTQVELGIVYDRLRERPKAVESWKAALEMLQEAKESESANPEISREISRIREFLQRRGTGRRPPPGPSENLFIPQRLMSPERGYVPPDRIPPRRPPQH
jgi:tetratricopeptide (TPR) repeat protein